MTAETANKISAADDPPDPDRGRYVDSFTQALNSALEALKPRDRMRLNFHYVEDLTLKEIGRLMGEHESTVSRRLARSRAQLRRQVESFSCFFVQTLQIKHEAQRCRHFGISRRRLLGLHQQGERLANKIFRMIALTDR